jgi:hypothetical protein
MADRSSLPNANHPQFTAKNSRPGLPTIFSADDASSVQSESSSSVAISDASSVKSSEYAESLISDCMSATSSECSDDFYHSDGDTTTNDDSTMVSDLPDIKVAARSTKHPRSKRSEINEGAGEGKACKPINLTDIETGNEFARDQAKRRDVDEGNKNTPVNATAGQTHGRDRAKLQGVSYVSSFAAKLQGVSYVSSFAVASTNKGLSVVEPIGKRQASEAFHRVIPNTIPIDSRRDDFSSIGPVSLKLPRFSVKSNDYWYRAEDVRAERQTRAPSNQEQEDSTKAPCFLGQRSDLEVLFIAIISVSLFILVVLLAIVLAK